MSALRWPSPRSKTALVDDPLDVDEHGVPPTPGFKDTPMSIAQLAMPSPEEASPSSSSNASHEPPSSEDRELVKHDVAARRVPNRLRKAPPPPPPSSYPFSFVAEDPSPMANFPYSFHSSPTSPASSFVNGPARALSMHQKISRKLTKRRPSAPSTASADASMVQLSEIAPAPPLQRRNTFNFSLRLKKTPRKATTTQSEDGHGTLPSLPPRSPLALNMPGFLPFHIRRRDSWHVRPSSESPVEHRHSSPTHADALSEAAWTGVEPKGLEKLLGNRGGWKSTWSLTLAEQQRPASRPKPRFIIGDEPESPTSSSHVLTSRPPLLRRAAVVAPPKRRWTLAMALTDEDISDELLVEKLETLRSRSRAGSFAASDADDPADWDRVWAACNDELEPDEEPPPLPPKDELRPLHPLPSPSSMPAFPTQPSASGATWQSARRALLTCRELVRTERHYLSSLEMLLAGDTRTPPPALMQAYAAALARESAGLIRRMENDPSAWGVSAAFLGAEDALEAAFVAWCGVVGGWFVDVPKPQSRRRRLSKTRSQAGSDYGAPDNEEATTASGSASKRTTPWRHSSFSAVARPMSVLSMTAIDPPPLPGTTTKRAKSRRELEKRATVRDLAILPTQRIMRYVLLYRDLLDHTPAQSPARALVARAADAAVRIAQRCDRAQGNAAFLQGAPAREV